MTKTTSPIKTKTANPRNAITLYLDDELKNELDRLVSKSSEQGIKKNAVYLRLLGKGIKEETRRGK